MALIRDEDRNVLTDLFAQELVSPVKLVMFTQRRSALIVPAIDVCEFCEQTEQLVREVAGLSHSLSVEVHDFVTDEAKAKSYGVDKIPAIALIAGEDYGVRFYGIPSGYEFTTLIEDIVDVSRGTTGLSPETKTELRRLDTDVHIQVFITPTCPYCPGAVRIAHQIAIESKRVRADVIEVTEFPHLAHRYNVLGVPKVVLNETAGFEGALPEAMFVQEVLKAVGR